MVHHYSREVIGEALSVDARGGVSAAVGLDVQDLVERYVHTDFLPVVSSRPPVMSAAEGKKARQFKHD